MKVIKNGREREIRANQLERHLRNGWQKGDQEVKATLVAPQRDTEHAPAVGTQSEQGDNNDETEGED